MSARTRHRPEPAIVQAAWPHRPVHPGVDPSASIGDRTVIDASAEICAHARVGTNCRLGMGAYVGPGVLVGRNCVVGDGVSLQEASLVEDDVRIGPDAVLAGRQMSRLGRVNGDEVLAGVTVRTGAVIGARAICTAPATIGHYAWVAEGAVVTGDVPDFALVEGAPAEQRGWVGRTGARLMPEGDGEWRCPATGDRFVMNDGILALSRLR